MEKKEFSETKTYTSPDGKTVVTTTVSGSVSTCLSTVSSAVTTTASTTSGGATTTVTIKI